jgi:isopropylmalate/homocitrate/citramalate synthase
MGNGLANTMVSIAAGAKYVHTVAYGIGERAGNVKLEGVLVNLTAILEEAGKRVPWNLQSLSHVLENYCDLVGIPIPGIGMMGTNAFRTSLGIHTAAMLKLRKLAEEVTDTEAKNELVHMSNTVYSSIHPEAVGRKSNIRISPHSGKSTVELYFQLHKLDMSRLTDKITLTILMKAKEKGTELSYEEIVDIIED